MKGVPGPGTEDAAECLGQCATFVVKTISRSGENVLRGGFRAFSKRP
jgi:hypothetical protein